MSDFHSALGNELVELDPNSGAIRRHLYVGRRPTRLAISDDGNVAYVGLQGTNTIAQVDLITFSVRRVFPVGVTERDGPLFVESLTVQPGHPEVVVASLSSPYPSHVSVRAFRDGQPLSKHDDIADGTSWVTFTGATSLYGYSDERDTLSHFRLEPDGVVRIGDMPLAIDGDNLERVGRFIMSSDGQLVDPATATVVRTFPAGANETTSNNRTTVVSGSKISQFVTTTGAFVGERILANIDSAVDLIATGDGFIVQGYNEIALIGPHVTPGEVKLPPAANPRVDSLVETIVPLSANDLAFDPSRVLLYATHADALVALDPASGDIVKQLSLGANPQLIALADDNTTAYVTLAATNDVARVDLATFEEVDRFNLGGADANTPFAANDIDVRPGAPGDLAVALRTPYNANSSGYSRVGLFLDGVRAPLTTPSDENIDRIDFANADTLYGYDTRISDHKVFQLSVDSSGVAVASAMKNGLPPYTRDIEAGAGGYLFTSHGDLINPTRRVDGSRPRSGIVGGAVEAVYAANRMYLVGDSSLNEYTLGTLRQVGYRQLGTASTNTVLESTGTGLATLVAGGILLLNPPACKGLAPTVPQTDGTIVGTTDDDVIVGTSGPDVINGGGGNDTICGGGGNDSIAGGDGSDRLLGGDGKDWLRGDAGNDQLSGDAGNDIVDGGQGNDRLYGGDGDDRLNGGTESDYCVLKSGSDITSGCDTIVR